MKKLLLMTVVLAQLLSCNLGNESGKKDIKVEKDQVVDELKELETVEEVETVEEEKSAIETPPVVMFTVNFDTDGGDAILSQEIKSGDLLPKPFNPVKSSFKFVNWYRDTEYNELWDFNTDVVLQDITLYAKFREYIIGDIGPAGGIVFYDDEADGIDNIVGYRYMEAAPLEQGIKKVYGLIEEWIPAAVATGIGTGKQNTIEIIKVEGDVDIAATFCLSYSITTDGKTFNDWFLPSKDELDALNKNLSVSGIYQFPGDYYWSSTKSVTRKDYGWRQAFGESNHQYELYIINERNVHPVRYF